MRESETADKMRTASGFPKPNPESWRNMLHILRAQPGVEIKESAVPLPTVEELEGGDFSGFSNLPSNCQKALKRLAWCSRMYLAGFFMFDHRTKDERDEWEISMQRRYGDEFNFPYDWSKMRANAMTKIINPLKFVTDTMEQKLGMRESDMTGSEQALLALSKKLPGCLVPPHHTLEFDASVNAYVVRDAVRYNDLPTEKKMEIVADIDVVAREFLALIDDAS